MVPSIINSKSKTFLAFCFSFLTGVAMASFGEFAIERKSILLTAFALLFFLGLCWQKRTVRFFILFILFFGIGIGRYQVAFPEQPDFPTGTTHVVGFVSADPDIRIDGIRYIVRTDEYGKVFLETPLYPQYRYGDVLRLGCELERPKPFDDFRYDMYLAKFGVFAVCRNPTIEKIGEGNGNAVMLSILRAKENIASRIVLLWPEPHASFMAGLLYGYRGGLGTLQEAFNRTGVSHIVAISGYNISIIATILLSFFTFFHIRRQRAFWIVCMGIIAFTLFVGASPSVVRASVMGMLALLAKQVGRLSRPVYLLVPTAAFMVFQNPFILVWDAGFQLSFAATLGLLSFAPLLERRIGGIMAQTLSAILYTLPLLLYNFGRLSLVAPLVNLLILWLIPWLMLLGTMALFFHAIFVPLGMALAWVAWIGLEYILQVVQWFGDLSFAALDFELPWWGAIFGYVAIYFLYSLLHRRVRPQLGN